MSATDMWVFGVKQEAATEIHGEVRGLKRICETSSKNVWLASKRLVDHLRSTELHPSWRMKNQVANIGVCYPALYSSEHCCYFVLTAITGHDGFNERNQLITMTMRISWVEIEIPCFHALPRDRRVISVSDFEITYCYPKRLITSSSQI